VFTAARLGGNTVDRHWYAVQTKPHKEELVLSRMAETGVPTYRPRLLTLGRRRGRVVSLFPNYLFVRLGTVEESVSVRYAPGVSRLLGFGDQAQPVDAGLIALMREREGENGVIQPAQFFHFQLNQHVRLRGGAFDGLEAVFEGYMRRAERVQVLLTVLGRSAHVEVSANQVVPLAM